VAVVFDSAGAGFSTVTSGAQLEGPAPATVNAGDMLIAHVAWNNTTDEPSTPSGWTLLDGPRNIGTTPNGRHWVFGKIADGTEDGATIQFGTAGGVTKRWGRIYRFTGRTSGAGITDLATGFAATSHATDPQMPTVTTSVAGALAIALVAQNDDNAQASATGETGGDWVEAIAEYTATTGTGVGMGLQTSTPTGDPGTVTGGSIATANDPCGVIGFSLAPFAVLAGSTTLPITFDAPTTGTIEKFSSVVFPITFTATTAGVAHVKGRVSWSVFEVPAVGAVEGAASAVFTFTASTVGKLDPAFGATTLTETFGAATLGKLDPALGASAVSLVFGETTAGRVEMFAASSLTITFGVSEQGFATRFGATTLPLVWGVTTDGQIQGAIFGASSLGIVFQATTQGFAEYFAASSLAETFGIVTSGTRIVLGGSSLPVVSTITTSGVRERLGSSILAVQFDRVTLGTLAALGATSLPLVFSITTKPKTEVLLDPIYTGAIALASTGAIDGREQGRVADTVVGLVEEDVTV